MTDTGPPHLDQAMKEQLLRLDLTWKEVAERAGMTEYHLQRIRSGKAGLTDRAAAKIDRAMEWELKSARRIYDEGGEPTPRAREHSPPPALPPGVPPKPESVPIPLEDWATLTPDERTVITGIFAGKRHRERQRRGG